MYLVNCSVIAISLDLSTSLVSLVFCFFKAFVCSHCRRFYTLPNWNELHDCLWLMFLVDMLKKTKIPKIHVIFSIFHGTNLNCKKESFSRWNQLAQLFLVFENGPIEVCLCKKIKIPKIHVRFSIFRETTLNFEKESFPQWNQLAQLFLVFENGPIEVSLRKNTKIPKIHVRFSEIQKNSIMELMPAKSGPTTPSELRERSVQSWLAKRADSFSKMMKILTIFSYVNSLDFCHFLVKF